MTKIITSFLRHTTTLSLAGFGVLGYRSRDGRILANTNDQSEHAEEQKRRILHYFRRARIGLLKRDTIHISMYIISWQNIACQ